MTDEQTENTKTSLRNPMAALARALERQAESESDAEYRKQKLERADRLRERARTEPLPSQSEAPPTGAGTTQRPDGR